MIIDVDSHWELGRVAPDDHPLGPWLDQLPTGLDFLAFAIAGDLLRALPAEQRPSSIELLPAMVEAARQRGGKAILHPPHQSTADERVSWMDSVGIDHCLVNPGGYWQYVALLDEDARPAAIRRANDFLTEQLRDGAGRLHAVALLDWTSPAAAVAELERVRNRGARAFFLHADDGAPMGGRSPGHPAWDPLWAVAAASGMVAVIHVGNTSSNFSGWADIGWAEPGGAGTAGLARLANTQRAHAAQNILAGLLYGGAFARHPNLTVLVAELRAGWFPHFVEVLARQSTSSPILGEWPWDVSGQEMLHGNVRLTPLPGFGDEDALEVLDALPEMVVFSSDFPHLEGNADPIELYRPDLDALDSDLRNRFLGENIAECFARTGEPLG